MVCLICGDLIADCANTTLRIKIKKVYKEFFDILDLDIDNYNEELNSSGYQSFCNECCSELANISKVLAAFNLLEQEIETFRTKLKNQLLHSHEEQSKSSPSSRNDENCSIQIIRRKVCNDLALLQDKNIFTEDRKLFPKASSGSNPIEISDIQSWNELNLAEEEFGDDDGDDSDFGSSTDEDAAPSEENETERKIKVAKVISLRIATDQARRKESTETLNWKKMKEDALENKFNLKMKKLEDMTQEEIKAQTYLASLRSRTRRMQKQKIESESESESGTEYDSDFNINSDSSSSDKVVKKRLFSTKKRSMSRSVPFQPGDPCTVCGEKFDKLSDLKDHLYKAHDNKTLTCPVCGKMFKTNTTMKRHFDYVHNNIPRPKEKRRERKGFLPGTPCFVCKEKFDTKELLSSHQTEVHNDEIHKCPFCPKWFKGRDSWRKHTNVKHVEEKRKLRGEWKRTENFEQAEPRYSLCPICGISVLVLKKHMLVHDNEKRIPVKCDVCNKVFVNDKAHARHFQLFHSETANNFMCQSCGKTYGSSYKLKVHENNVHLGNKKFSCQHCPKKTSSKWHLNEHVKINHAGYTYKCSIDNCEKTFRSASQLRYHKMNHSGERFHFCSFCNKGFKMKRAMEIHETTHTPHITRCACEICGKRFTHQNYLNLHLFHHKKMERQGKTLGIRKPRRNPEKLETDNMDSVSSSPSEVETQRQDQLPFYVNLIGTNNVIGEPNRGHFQF